MDINDPKEKNLEERVIALERENMNLTNRLNEALTLLSKQDEWIKRLRKASLMMKNRMDEMEKNASSSQKNEAKKDFGEFDNTSFGFNSGAPLNPTFNSSNFMNSTTGISTDTNPPPNFNSSNFTGSNEVFNNPIQPPNHPESSFKGKNVRVYTKEDIISLKGHKHEVFSCLWCPNDPNILASGSGDGTSRIWNVLSSPQEPKILQHFDLIKNNERKGLIIGEQPQPSGNLEPPKTSGDVTTLDWNPDGSLLATGSYNGKGTIWNRETGGLVKILNLHKGPIFSIKWNKSGNYIGTGCVDNTVVIWDILNDRILHHFRDHKAPTLDIDWSKHDDFTLASCSTDKTIVVYQNINDRGQKTMIRFQGHHDEVNAIQWNPRNPHLLASCSDDFSAKIWSLNNQQTYISNLTEHRKEIYTLTWSPTDPHLLSTASFDTTIKLWDVQKTNKSVHTLTDHTDPVYSVSFSPCGKFLASGSFDSNVHVYDVKNGQVVKTFRGTGSVFQVDWNCEGDKIAACFSNSITEVFNVTVIDLKK